MFISLFVLFVIIPSCLFQLVQPSTTVIILTVPSLTTVYVNTAMVRLKNNTGGMPILGSSKETVIENVVVSIHYINSLGFRDYAIS